MYLSEIKLWNFRKYGSDNFDLAKPNLNLHFNKTLNVLIGENDSGKTAIIDAIKLVLKTHSHEWIKVEDDDFYKDQTRFRIELILEDLKDEEAKNFIEWLGWNDEGKNAKPYLRLIYDVKRNKERVFPFEVKAGVDDSGHTLDAEARDYLKVTYLKPLRDAENELIAKKNSRLSQILQNHEAFKDKEHHHLIKLFEKFNKSIEGYFEGKDPDKIDLPDQNGKTLKAKIDEFIQAFCDDTKKTDCKVAKADLKSILEKLILSIMNVLNPGLGTLNRLFMAAELLHLNKDNYYGLKLGLIEELEAHLHPQAQMKVIEKLQSLSDIQLILTTHSPNLASKVKLEHLIICEGTNAFPMGKEFTRLEPENYVHLERFLDVTKANLFFAKGIILVEGWAEELLIPVIANKIGIDLTKHEVSVVNIGNTGFSHYSKIFLRKDGMELNIPVAIIRDIDELPFAAKPLKPDPSDNRKKGTELYSEIEIAEKLKSKITDLEKSFNKSKNKVFLTDFWTLEWCLFKSVSLSDIFQKTVKSIHPGLYDSGSFEDNLIGGLKKEHSFDKTEIAYKLAQALETDNLICIDKTNANDTIHYLIKAIKHASRQN
jgi:putative ATP-dependent endonuclease of the OLD family